MKFLALLIAVLLISSVLAWGDSDVATVVSNATALRERGDFKGADALLGKTLDAKDISTADRKKLLFQRDLLMRLKHDYSLTKEQLFASLRDSVKDLTRKEFEQWVAEGRFDSRPIDGTIRYMYASDSNIYFSNPELLPRQMDGKDEASIEKGRLALSRLITKAAVAGGTPYVLPHHFRCVMTVTAKRDAVPPGETVRAWIPVPRKYPFQTDFKMAGSSSPIKDMEPENSPIRSVYLEQLAQTGEPTRFQISYSYTEYGVHFTLDPKRIQPPDLNDPELKKFVTESPHVVFTPKIKALAVEIAGKETNPMLQARAFYDWIGGNITFRYAREYSTLTNISDYTLSNHYGDCGEEAMLFITLCRYKGIPARWQAGWNTFPGGVSNHDWAEIYLAPYGWLPVDPCIGMSALRSPSLTADERRELHDFYFGSLDFYRMAANSDHSQALHPEKNAPRSDDVDFQRGELEYRDNNIYLDKFNYSLRVEDFQ